VATERLAQPQAGPDRIELRGMRLVGVVGVLPEERTRAQPLEVDLDLVVELAPAGASDDLRDTVDYGAVCDRVAATVGGGAPALLEHLAEDVAAAALDVDERIEAVTVALRKLRPPVAHDIASTGVRLTRTRRSRTR
jgi:7,8-dihydroneopterin aldolase/epimerase/oxygenase